MLVDIEKLQAYIDEIDVDTNIFDKTFIEELQNKLKIVEKNSFFLCSELKTVEFLSDEIELKYNSFSDCESLLLISIPNARLVKICGRIITFESGFLSFFVSSKADVVFVKT